MTAFAPGVLLLAALLVACGGTANPDATDARVSIDTIGGIPHIRSSGEPPTWATQELLSLGTALGPAEQSPDGPSPEEFGRIVSVIADAEGAIYVADASSSDIRVFDESGELLRRIGRRGCLQLRVSSALYRRIGRYGAGHRAGHSSGSGAGR